MAEISKLTSFVILVSIIILGNTIDILENNAFHKNLKGRGYLRFNLKSVRKRPKVCPTGASHFESLIYNTDFE